MTRIYSDSFDINVPGQMPNHVYTYGNYVGNIIKKLGGKGAFPFRFDGVVIGVSTLDKDHGQPSLSTEVTSKGYRLLYESLFRRPAGKLEVEY